MISNVSEILVRFIHLSFEKLRKSKSLAEKTLIMTMLDRALIEHPVFYCKAMHPHSYESDLEYLLLAGKITKKQILNDMDIVTKSEYISSCW